MRAIACLALALAACGPERVRSVPVPPEYLTCADLPAAPELPEPGAIRDQLVLGYIVGLRTAYASCRAAVDGTRAWNGTMGK